MADLETETIGGLEAAGAENTGEDWTAADLIKGSDSGPDLADPSVGASDTESTDKTSGESHPQDDESDGSEEASAAAEPGNVWRKVLETSWTR